MNLTKDRSLFYVESPFQLIQCVEAIHEFEIKKSKIIIRENSSVTNNEQLRAVVKALKLNQCTFMKCHLKSFRGIFLVLRLIFEGYFYRRIFIGDENSRIFNLAVKFININKVVLMDDGVARINSSKRWLIFKRFSMFPFGVNTTLNKFSYFSTYIERQNTYQHIIIGMDLISAGICTVTDYFEFITIVAGRFSSEPDSVLYIPHRNEDQSDLDGLNKIGNIRIQKTQLPIELVGLELLLQPITISTFFSSAIFSMEKIYHSSQFYIYKIPECKIQKRRNSIDKIYNYIESTSNFNVINL